MLRLRKQSKKTQNRNHVVIYKYGYSHYNCGKLVHTLVSFKLGTCANLQPISKEDLILLRLSFNWDETVYSSLELCKILKK